MGFAFLWQQTAKWRIRNSSMWRVQLLAVVQDINQAKAKYIHDVGGKWQQKKEEIAIIPPTNAVVHPRTVVVKILRTHKNKKVRRYQDRCDTEENNGDILNTNSTSHIHTWKTKNRTDLDWVVKSHKSL